MLFFFVFFFFTKHNYAFKPPGQFSKVNAILQQTGRQFYWKVNPSLHIQITGSITMTVLSQYKLQLCGAHCKATDSRSKCCESTSAGFCLQRETLPQPHHWAHVCREIPALLCKTKLRICTNLRPTVASNLQRLKTESPQGDRFFPRNKGSADPKPPELSLNCATNKLSCCQHLPEVAPSMGSLWKLLPTSQNTQQEHSMFPTEHSWKPSVSPQVLHAPVASVRHQ